LQILEAKFIEKHKCFIIITQSNDLINIPFTTIERYDTGIFFL